MKESQYQSHLITKLSVLFPGCMILKNDATYRQGIPDLSVFFKDKWAMLEVKASASARRIPNQVHYIKQLDEAKVFPAKIVTEVTLLKGFYSAEDYHQDYATLHPDSAYIYYNDLPKIANLKRIYGLDLTAADSHQLRER